MCFEKKFLYLQYRKKQLKITIMEKTLKTVMKQNYRITVIFKDEVVITKFNKMKLAIDAIIKMKELFPDLFLSAALEEKRKKWEVIWTLQHRLMENH